MLQALYDGTWLNRPGSELLLSWLAQATWRKGLVAKLPPDAEVAHKYGIRYLFDPDHPEMVPAGAPSLHLGDCGILYHPKRPMMVCVMTEATTSAAAEGVIGDVAKAAWDAATTLRSH